MIEHIKIGSIVRVVYNNKTYECIITDMYFTYWSKQAVAIVRLLLPEGSLSDEKPFWMKDLIF